MLLARRKVDVVFVQEKGGGVEHGGRPSEQSVERCTLHHQADARGGRKLGPVNVRLVSMDSDPGRGAKLDYQSGRILRQLNVREIACANQRDHLRRDLDPFNWCDQFDSPCSARHITYRIGLQSLSDREREARSRAPTEPA
jgi:hypothetical protein